MQVALEAGPLRETAAVTIDRSVVVCGTYLLAQSAPMDHKPMPTGNRVHT